MIQLCRSFQSQIIWTLIGDMHEVLPASMEVAKLDSLGIYIQTYDPLLFWILFHGFF